MAKVSSGWLAVVIHSYVTIYIQLEFSVTVLRVIPSIWNHLSGNYMIRGTLLLIPFFLFVLFKINPYFIWYMIYELHRLRLWSLYIRIESPFYMDSPWPIVAWHSGDISCSQGIIFRDASTQHRSIHLWIMLWETGKRSTNWANLTAFCLWFADQCRSRNFH